MGSDQRCETADVGSENQEVEETFSIVTKTKFNNKAANSILDSGSGVSVMDLGTFECLELNSEIKNLKKCDEVLRDASDNTMDVLGVAEIVVQVCGTGKRFSQEFCILNQRSYRNVILGRDLMKKFKKVTFDFENDAIQLDGCRIRGVSPPRRKVSVRVVDNVLIPARSETIAVVGSSKDYSFVTGNFKPQRLPGQPNIYVSKAMVTPNVEGKFVVTMVNTGEQPVTLRNRQVVGSLNSPDEIIAAVDLSGIDDAAQKVEIERVMEKMVSETNLSRSQRVDLLALLSEYSDVFAADPRKPSQTDLVDHKITVDTRNPIYMKPRRIPLAWEKEVDDQVQEMCRNDIIRPSGSPWNAPILLVKKKDNTIRFVCDFRALNEVTKKDTYPLPQIKDVIDKMQGMKFWSTLDAASAYWSIPMAEQDKEKTSFSVPRGKFEFNVMTFGLCNAGASYQRMMDMVLSGLSPTRALAYVDDIVVFSRTFEEHLCSLQEVFDRLRNANISLKLSKCVFAASQVDYLGFVLSEKGVQPQDRLTEAVVNFATPKNKKDIKRFLGLAGFYRDFIPDFAEIASPLNRLTRDQVAFEWSPVCESAFNSLKSALVSSPVLAFPQTNQDFLVEVDASMNSVGGVLSQRQADGEVHPVAYFSTALKDNQKDLSPYTLEAYALVLATRHWNTYLMGNPFVVFSDHNPLVYLKTKKNPKGVIARWITELEGYDFSVEYVKGKSNVKADALSRNENSFLNEVPIDRVEENIYAISATNMDFSEQLKSEQDADAITKYTKTCVMNKTAIEEGQLRRVAKQLRVVDGILTKNGRPVVPPSMRKFVVSEIHKLGHYGTEKLYDLVKNRFYWPKMFGYITNFCNECEVCSQCKVDSPTPKAPLVPIREPQAPLEFIAIDVAHLPTTKAGHRYILLIGDIFSKYIEAVPMPNQEADTIVDAVWRSWITKLGCPAYIHSDQGSNVDGETVRAVCEKFNIQKRRTSGYHSEGNGFAERNIRSIREVLRTLLLDFEIPQSQWTTILPSVIFALNTSLSSATKRSPYEVVFGRLPTLPIDLVFGTRNESVSAPSPEEYVKDLRIQLRDTLAQVNENLDISRKKMMRQYNRNLNFYDYKPMDPVWLKKKVFKPGESKKLAPRKTGPWCVLRKLPNGVNFEIQDPKSKATKIVHHNRLSPAPSLKPTSPNRKRQSYRPKTINSPTPREFSASDSDSSSSDSTGDEPDARGPATRRYPNRVRVPRVVEGAVSWDDLNDVVS